MNFSRVNEFILEFEPSRVEGEVYKIFSSSNDKEDLYEDFKRNSVPGRFDLFQYKEPFQELLNYFERDEGKYFKKYTYRNIHKIITMMKKFFFSRVSHSK